MTKAEELIEKIENAKPHDEWGDAIMHGDPFTIAKLVRAALPGMLEDFGKWWAVATDWDGYVCPENERESDDANEVYGEDASSLVAAYLEDDRD